MKNTVFAATLSALAIAFAAAPAQAQDQSHELALACVERDVSPELAPAFIGAIGSAEAKDINPQLEIDFENLLTRCAEEHGIRDDQNIAYGDFVVSTVMTDAAQEQMDSVGFDYAWLDVMLDEELAAEPDDVDVFMAQIDGRLGAALQENLAADTPNLDLKLTLLSTYLTGRITKAVASKELRGS